MRQSMRSVLHALYFRWQCGDLKICTEGHSDVTKPNGDSDWAGPHSETSGKGPDGWRSLIPGAQVWSEKMGTKTTDE